MKRTHKLRAIGDAGEIVGFSRNRAEAAAQLGVNRSTLHRWIKAGKVPEPGSARPKSAGKVDSRVAPDQSPESWLKAARSSRPFSATELQLLDLARAALALAYDSEDEKTQLSAMNRFQGLVKQLGLSAPAAAAAPPARVERPVRRAYVGSMDPRKMIMAVK